MPKFRYVAKDVSGKTVTGEIMAGGQTDVVNKLQMQNMIPMSITEVSMQKSGGGFQSFNDKITMLTTKVKLTDIVFFTRQMVTFLNAGVTLTKSIKNIADSQKNVVVKSVLNQLYEDINAGSDFSNSLAKHPKIFDQMYVNIVKAGETSGNLDKALGSLANYKEKSAQMQQTIKSAMMYPKFVMIFTGIIVFVILWKIIPVFQGLFSSLGGELPGPTQLLVDASELIQNNFVLVIVGILGIRYGIAYAFKLKAVRNFWDKFTISVPIFGELVRQIIVSRVSSVLALLLSSGTSMLESIEIASKVANNSVYEAALKKAATDVSNGVELSVSFKKTNRFDDVFIQLLETGEETGKIDELMQKIAEYYDAEVAVKVKGFSSLMEPLLIVIMGVVIGSIVVAIYLPIFTMGETLQ
ncbi:MAG: type II secretion system F family protein [Candidatus Delongbacteria bacterium]|nr:type II secretion system F family protein [Candidatus Delongbacteria bacterium]MCG2759731.1 type II secretion system F family protein [Candidatus Delongbacteria bacterium]